MVPMESRTKIVATLGPASEAPEVLDRLLLAGVDMVRLNLSHGTVDEHVRRLREVRICLTKSFDFRTCSSVDRRACTRVEIVAPASRGG